MNTQTDQRGEFRLESSPTQSEVGVSETSPQRIDASSLAGCKVQADVAGFASSTLNIINNSIMDNPNIGTITLKPEETLVPRSAPRPEKARPHDALNSFNNAVAADPDFISPYVHIAAIQALQKNWEASLMAVRQSLKLNPSGSPWLWYLSALANLHLNQPRFAGVSARTSLAMDPSHLVIKAEQLLAVVLRPAWRLRRGNTAPPQ